jgi:uncharacterized protein YjbJ (UPF0337 family)
MGSTADKIKGVTNEAVGNVKQAAGRAMDRPDVEAEGVVQERKGEAQQLKGEAKDAIKRTVDRA